MGMSFSSQPAKAFKPQAASTVTISVTTSSVATALPVISAQYRMYNAGAVPVFFNFGESGSTASVATATPIAPGAVEVFSPPSGSTHVAAIVASGSATLYVTAGEGV
jgi:hypothetical protein